MHPTKLKQLEDRLESQMPLIGSCLRQRTARALAQDGSPDAVRILAKAIARNDDRKVLAIALDALRQVKKQQCIDEVCAVWSITRHQDLASLLVKKNWVAAAPVDVKVLTALKVGQMEAIAKSGKEIVEPLLQAFSDIDPEIASRASQCASAIANPDVVDELCQRWLKTRDRLLEQIILQGKYVARQPAEVRVLSALKVERLEVVTSGGKEVVEPLIKAFSDTEREIAHRADQCAAALKNPAAIDYLCEWWVQTRNKVIGQAIAQQGYVARQPIQVRVLSALKAGQLEVITEQIATVLELILQALQDTDVTIAERAKLVLKDLKKPEDRELFCHLVIEQDHYLACEIAIASHYAPRDLDQRAIFYFLTQQWDKYESLDFEYKLLQGVYELANDQLRKRIVQKIRQTGRVEWVRVITGGGQRKRLGEMSPTEWETMLAVLTMGKHWEEMWQLAQVAPVEWSVKLLHQLKKIQWISRKKEEQVVLENLKQLAENCKGNAPVLADIVFCETEFKKDDSNIIFTNHIDGKLLNFPLALSDKTTQFDDFIVTPNGKSLIRINQSEFDQDKDTFITEVHFYKLSNSKILKTLTFEGYYESSFFSPNGKILAFTVGYYGSKTCYLIDLYSLQEIAKIDLKDEDKLLGKDSLFFDSNEDTLIYAFLEKGRSSSYDSFEGYREDYYYNCLLTIKFYNIVQGTLIEEISEELNDPIIDGRANSDECSKLELLIIPKTHILVIACEYQSYEYENDLDNCDFPKNTFTKLLTRVSKLQIWNFKEKQKIVELRVDPTHIKKDLLCFKYTEQFLAIINSITPFLVNSSNRERLIYEGIEEINLTSLEFNRTAQVLVGRGNDFLQLWNLLDGQVLMRLEGRKNKIVFSLDGKIIATEYFGKNNNCFVQLWNINDKSLLCELKGSFLGFSPDTQTLIAQVRGIAKTIQIWKLQIWKYEIAHLSLKSSPVEQMQVEDIKRVQKVLHCDGVSDIDKSWLEFFSALLNWRRRFDIEMEEPSQQIDAGEFDIEIAG